MGSDPPVYELFMRAEWLLDMTIDGHTMRDFPL